MQIEEMNALARIICPSINIFHLDSESTCSSNSTPLGNLSILEGSNAAKKIKDKRHNLDYGSETKRKITNFFSNGSIMRFFIHGKKTFHSRKMEIYFYGRHSFCQRYNVRIEWKGEKKKSATKRANVIAILEQTKI